VSSVWTSKLPSAGVSWPNGNRTGTTPRATSCKMWNQLLPRRSSCHCIHHDEVVVTRLRAGHTHLTFSHLLSLNPPPTCATCNKAQLSGKRVLLDCPRYTVRRQKFCLPVIISDMLGDNSDILTRILTFYEPLTSPAFYNSFTWTFYHTVTMCINYYTGTNSCSSWCTFKPTATITTHFMWLLWIVLLI
jgi:hypothetical protein